MKALIGSFHEACARMYTHARPKPRGVRVHTHFEASGILRMGHQAIWFNPVINDSARVSVWVQAGCEP